MALNINTDVWGSPENWNTNNVTGNYIKYTPNRRTYNGMYENNLQQLNQDIDLSIAPWYINKKSVLRDIQGYYYYNDWKLNPDNPTASERGKGLLKTFETTKPTYAPFVMSIRAESGEIFTKQANKYTAYKRDGVTLTTPHVGNRYPITNFRYDKIKLSPVIYATGDDPSQGEAFSAIQNNLNPTGYPQYRTTRPYIVNVGFRIFADINGTWTQISATLDLDTILYGDYNASNWYSGQSDCHLLLNPYANDYSTGTNYNSWFFEWQPNNDMLADGFCNGESVAKYGYYSFTSDTRDGVQCGLMPGFRFSERTEKNTGVASIMRGLPWRNVASLADYNDFIDDLKKELAYIGLPFVIKQEDISLPFGSDNVYLPVFDEHRQTTGEFLSGSASLTLPNSTWQWIYDLDALPDPPPDETPDEENDYGDTTNLGAARGLFPAGVNIYLMSRSDYTIFMSELNSYYQGSSPDDWTLDFQGVNPSDYILSAYYTPYNFLKSDTKSAVKIGPLTLTTTAYELSQGSPPDDPNKWKTFTYGTRKVTTLFNDFRDYEPFTTVELYLPLAGTVQLETAYIMNHDITVTYYFDLMSMSGVACVYRDNMLYKTSDFQLGCQVPLLSQNMGSIQNQIMSLDTARKQNNIRLTAATTATTGSAIKALSGKASDVSNLAGGAGLIQIASGVINADKIDYDMTHTPASVSVTGAAEPMNNYSVGQLTPKLIIKRPLMLPDKNDEIYAHTVGNACLINTTVGEMSGLIVCSNVDLSGIAATSTELSAIQSALTTGIYV